MKFTSGILSKSLSCVHNLALLTWAVVYNDAVRHRQIVVKAVSSRVQSNGCRYLDNASLLHERNGLKDGTLACLLEYSFEDLVKIDG